ncbi:MBL fold metallo-hydrolase [Paraburkholderia lycopersici]|uniref:MBL fold metallo-hydrolase n=1 Tax=Paraburkholderia lycopersici TaxID=416944 RepID=UPI00318427A7
MSVCWLPEERVLFSGDLVENRCGVYAGNGYLRAWSKTLAKLRGLDADVLLPGRGVALSGSEQVEQAINGTQRFVDTVLDCVSAAIARGAPLKECYFQTLETMNPVFGD